MTTELNTLLLNGVDVKSEDKELEAISLNDIDSEALELDIDEMKCLFVYVLRSHQEVQGIDCPDLNGIIVHNDTRNHLAPKKNLLTCYVSFPQFEPLIDDPHQYYFSFASKSDFCLPGSDFY